ncbi:MAG: DUF1385 domain-containing protein [Oscillospiraceae bacterium]|nr:DUF1385 domain-containing protein [Oscillospiraceae bacterium]
MKSIDSENQQTDLQGEPSDTPAAEAANEPIKSKIGGQALIEGIMMKGVGIAAMACRLPDGSIDVETWAVNNGDNAPWYVKAPFIRGCFNFISSLADGAKCIMKSSQKQMDAEDGDDEEEELSKFEEWLYNTKPMKKLESAIEGENGKEVMNTLMIVMSVVSCIIAVCAVKFFPALISGLLGKLGAPDILKAIVEGIIKLCLLVGYMWVISNMKEMARTFRYHGAEHKTIACYEAGLPLTVENVKKQTRFHPRCGTSFIMLIILLGIAIGIFLPWDNVFKRFGMQLLLLPVETSVGYELIKLAGRVDNIFTRIISAPGLWLQRITTKEPDDKQIEVAIAAITPVLPEDRSTDKW